MTSFFRKFFGLAPARTAELAVFGKHPGWDDHIDDIGLNTDRLISVRRILYLEGIGRNIDSGDWDRLPVEQQIDFGHEFAWIHSTDVVVGRLWTSSDGKGRNRYPMVAAAQCEGRSLSWAVREVLPRLEKLEADCRQANEASRIVQLAQGVQRDLATSASISAPDRPALVRTPLARLAECGDLGVGQSGLVSLIYHMEKDMPAFFHGTHEERSDARLRPAHVRVPRCVPTPSDAILLWSSFFRTFLAPDVPILLFAPTTGRWVDVIVGEPTASEFFCLRASTQATALTTDIPYTVDEGFVNRVRRMIVAAGGTVDQGAPEATPNSAAP